MQDQVDYMLYKAGEVYEESINVANEGLLRPT